MGFSSLHFVQILFCIAKKPEQKEVVGSNHSGISILRFYSDDSIVQRYNFILNLTSYE